MIVTNPSYIPTLPAQARVSANARPLKGFGDLWADLTNLATGVLKNLTSSNAAPAAVPGQVDAGKYVDALVQQANSQAQVQIALAKAQAERDARNQQTIVYGGIGLLGAIIVGGVIYAAVK